MKKLIKFGLKLGFKVLKKITPRSWKRKVNRYLAKKYRVVDVVPMPEPEYDSKVLHVAIWLHGGYGDILINNTWVKEFYRRINCAVKIDIFLQPDRPTPFFIFYLMPYKVDIFDSRFFNESQGYDLKIEILHMVKLHSWSPHRVMNKDKQLYSIIEKISDMRGKYYKYYDNTPVHDGAWANLMMKMGKSRWSALSIDGVFDFDNTMGLLHLDISKYPVLDKWNLAGKQYITIHHGSDVGIVTGNKQQVKLWPFDYYIKLCELIKQKYPDLIIVQLGGISSAPMTCVDANCVGNLSMEESIIVLKHSLLHIDAESGLVHIKRQLRGKSIVLFGPTPIDYYKYAENFNINSPYYCVNCMWLMNDWFSNCINPNAKDHSECMKAIVPEMVMAQVTKYLNFALNKKSKVSHMSLEIYSSSGLKEYEPILADMCNAFGIKKLPVSEHIFSNESRFYIHASKQWEYPFAIDKIKIYSKQNERKKLKIVDIGGGGGLLSPYLSKLGYDTTVYDLNYTWDHNGDPEITEKLRLRWAEENGLKMEYGSIFNIPAEDETFDIITCISVVEHVQEKKYAFNEMLRVLKPGGILVLTYDLIEPGSENCTEDTLRAEIFTPELIHKTLTALGVKMTVNHGVADIRKALDDMQRDNVNIPREIAVGGMVLLKESNF